MITTIGARVHQWYRMGITDMDDLVWLTEFYLHEKFPAAVLAFTLQEAKRWYQAHPEISC